MKSHLECACCTSATQSMREFTRKADWDQLVGSDRNRYFNWDPPMAPIEQPGPPRTSLPNETEIDFDLLEFGDEYSGRYEGTEYSTDSTGNILDSDGKFVANPQEIPSLVNGLKGRPGRFRVTSKKDGGSCEGAE